MVFNIVICMKILFFIWVMKVDFGVLIKELVSLMFWLIGFGCMMIVFGLSRV